MPSSEESSSSSTWSFSMELLSHVHTLRVFLLPSSSQVQAAQDCTELEATLLSAPPALSCSWKAAGDAASHSLLLPLPVLLFDHSSTPQVSALTDCVQLSVHLLPLPPLHLHSFSSLSLDVTSSFDVSGAAHAANQADSDALEAVKQAQCKEDDDSGHQMGGTLESLHFPAVVDNGTHYDGEHGCTQRHMLPTDGSIHCVGSCEMEGTHGSPQGPPCDAGRYVCSSDVNLANKGIDNLQSDGAQHEIGRIGSPTHNNRTCNKIEKNRSKIGLDVREVCPNVIHPDGNGCNLDQFMHEKSSLGFLQAKEESTVHRCRSSCIGGVVEPSENSFLCQHTQFANKLHGQYDDFPSNNFSTEDGSQDHGSQWTASFVCKNCLTKISRKPVRYFVQLPCFDWREVAENWFGACCCSFGSAAEVLSLHFERNVQLRPGKCLVGPSTFYVDFCDMIVKDEPGLAGKETNTRQMTTPHFLAFGNGFMVWENQQSKIIKWLPVRCTSCASLIGAYPRTSTHCGPSKEGLHLFRCQVIIICPTDATFDDADATFDDIYQFKTFKDLLVKELRLKTDENTTYRFLIRSLSSKLPMLQMVVLNYDALICTGRINADDKEIFQCMSPITSFLNESGLQQSIKVLFLDCTRFSGDNVRSAELWAKEHDAETVFMLEEFVDRLRNELLANSMFCPANCGLFQSFMSSFLYTMRD